MGQRDSNITITPSIGAPAPLRILITGGSGFFGTNASVVLRSLGYLVLCASSAPEQYSQYQYFQTEPLIAMNVLEFPSVISCVERTKPDIIIHAAAFSAPLACEQHPEHAFAVNVGGTQNVLRAAQQFHIPLIFLSTDLVFNGERKTLENGWYEEHHVPDARIIYGKSKICAEQALMEHTYSRWVILRTSLMFGNRVEWANGFPQFALDLLKTHKPTTLFLDQYRTPAYIPDIVHAIDLLVENFVYNTSFCGKLCGKNEDYHLSQRLQPSLPTVAGQIFHCGGIERINRVDFVERCCKALDISSAGIHATTMEAVPNYTTRVQDVSLNSTKLQTMLQWQQTPLEKAFEEMQASFLPAD